MLISSGRLCPSIEIYLTFRNATCTGQPIHSFRNHSFYRVTKLVLNTGQSEPMHRLRRVRGDQAPLRQRPISACSPNKEFWEGLLNGTSLPDLRELEIVHREDPSWYAEVGEIKLDGLKKIEKLKIEHTPELNDNILLRSLAYANSLKRLELIDVESLSYDGMTLAVINLIERF